MGCYFFCYFIFNSYIYEILTIGKKELESLPILSSLFCGLYNSGLFIGDIYTLLPKKLASFIKSFKLLLLPKFPFIPNVSRL